MSAGFFPFRTRKQPFRSKCILFSIFSSNFPFLHAGNAFQTFLLSGGHNINWFHHTWVSSLRWVLNTCLMGTLNLWNCNPFKIYTHPNRSRRFYRMLCRKWAFSVYSSVSQISSSMALKCRVNFFICLSALLSVHHLSFHRCFIPSKN